MEFSLQYRSIARFVELRRSLRRVALGLGCGAAVGIAAAATTACVDEPGPDPGIAVDDFYVAVEGEARTVEAALGLLANDGEGAEAVDSYHRLTSELGTVVITADGGFVYEPVPGFWGRDRFSYGVVDDQGRESVAEVHLMVLPVTLELFGVAHSERGFVLDGGGPGDMLGAVIAGIGDVNGDGLDDVLVGAPRVDQGFFDNGRAYVIFGDEDPQDLSPESIASGARGFVVDGQGADERLASAASAAGDVNGDGLADFVVCAPRADTIDPAAGDESGRCYVIFGREQFPARLDLDGLAGSGGGFVINGSSWGGRAGLSVAGGGDVNGDGRDDIVVGAPNFAELELDRGRAWVIYGQADSTPVELAAIAEGEGGGGFAIDGLAAFEWAGAAVAIAGDVNGDGFADVLVGAPFATVDDADYSGRVYLVHGGGDAAVDVVYEVNDGRSLHFGRSVAGVGDVNGDGRDDFAIGAPEAKVEALAREGEVYVVFGGGEGEEAGTIDAGALLENGGGLRIRGESQLYGLAGLAIASAGDVDGDGLGDLLIAAGGAEVGGLAEAGRIYMVFGRSEGGDVDLAQVAAGVGGFAIDGEVAGARAGISVAGLGDVDGDRIADFAIGSAELDHVGVDSGRAYMLLGFGAVLP